MKIMVLGLGSWGIALACLLSENGHDILIWARSGEKIREVEKNRESSEYLPEIKIPEEISFTDNLSLAAEADVILSCLPSRAVRDVFTALNPFLKTGHVVVSASKGLEDGTLLCLSEVISDVVPHTRVCVLSGPSHAEEVSRKIPTTCVLAAGDLGLAKQIQAIFHNAYFRVYTNSDVLGVELGGALKNVISLAAGISDGMGNGDNTKAALMTRGIAEISRLGIEMGARLETFFGLSGIGDLIVTCTSMHSRNRRAGILLGQGKTLQETLAEVHMVVEGVHTAKAAKALADKHDVRMPIIEEINMTLFCGKDPRQAVIDLMTREMTDENRVKN